MTLTLNPRQHFFDIVQAADETRTEIEPIRSKLPAGRCRLVEARQAEPERLVHDALEGLPPAAGGLRQPRGNVLVECQGCAHDLMLLA